MDDLSSYWQHVPLERCSCARRVAHWSLWALKPYTSQWQMGGFRDGCLSVCSLRAIKLHCSQLVRPGTVTVPCVLSASVLSSPLPSWVAPSSGPLPYGSYALRSPGYLLKARVLKAQTPDHVTCPHPLPHTKDRIGLVGWFWPEESLSTKTLDSRFVGAVKWIFLEGGLLSLLFLPCAGVFCFPFPAGKELSARLLFAVPPSLLLHFSDIWVMARLNR